MEDYMLKYFNLRRMVLRYIGEKPNSEEHENLKAYLDVTLGPGWDAVTESEDQYLDRNFAERTSGTSAPPI